VCVLVLVCTVLTAVCRVCVCVSVRRAEKAATGWTKSCSVLVSHLATEFHCALVTHSVVYNCLTVSRSVSRSYCLCPLYSQLSSCSCSSQLSSTTSTLASEQRCYSSSHCLRTYLQSAIRWVGCCIWYSNDQGLIVESLRSYCAKRNSGQPASVLAWYWSLTFLRQKHYSFFTEIVRRMSDIQRVNIMRRYTAIHN